MDVDVQSTIEALSKAVQRSAEPEGERYAIAGHSLIRLFSGEWYFRNYLERREGSMTKWRDLFLDHYLHCVAQPLGVSLSRPSSQRRCIRAVDMVFGALSFSAGFRASQTVFCECAPPTLRRIAETMDDPCMVLSDKVERELRSRPIYHRLEKTPSADEPFVVECTVSGIHVGTGSGNSITGAEKSAARRALETCDGWKDRVIGIAEQNAENHAKLYSRKSMTLEGREDRLNALEKRLDIAFRDRRLLVQALSHRSYAHEFCGPEGHNERLEFLGDAVLDWVVTEFLLSKYPDDPDAVRRYAGAVVSNRRLSNVAATSLKLSEVVLLGCGVRNPSGQMLADAFEAILGALYLDQGIGACRLIVDALLHAHLSSFLREHRSLRIAYPKSHLNNLAQKRKLGKPALLFHEAPSSEGKPKWRCDVLIDGTLVASATAHRKKQAEVFATDDALHALLQPRASDT